MLHRVRVLRRPHHHARRGSPTSRLARRGAPDDGSGVARVVSDSVAIAAVVGALVAAALYAAAPATISAFAGPASAAVVPYALSYALIRCLAIPAAVITSSAQAAFLACKSPWQPLTSVGLAGVVNLIFDVVLVVGLGAGIRGAAVATAGSQICMASVLLIALLREGRRRRAAAAEKAARAAELAEEAGGGAREGAPGVDEEAINLPFLNALPRRFPSVATTVRFISIAAPVGFLTAIKVFFVGSLMQAVTAISPECSAANGVMSAIYFFWGVMGDGVSQAAQTFLPPVLGTKNASKTAATLLAGAMALGLISAVLASVLAVAFPGVFTNSAVVAELMRRRAVHGRRALPQLRVHGKRGLPPRRARSQVHDAVLPSQRRGGVLDLADVPVARRRLRMGVTRRGRRVGGARTVPPVPAVGERG